MQNAIESGQLEGWKQILDKLAAVVAGLTQANMACKRPAPAAAAIGLPD